MGQSFDTKQLIAKISKAEQTLSSKPLNAAAFKRIGEQLAPLAHKAVTTTKLGSDGMFTKGSKAGRWFNVPLEAYPSVHKSGYGVTIGRTRKSVGPWRVAESGRRAQTKGVKLEAGLRRNKNGDIKQKYKKAKRTLSASEGYDAWTKAEESMMAAAPERVSVHFAKAVLGVFQ